MMLVTGKIEVFKNKRGYLTAVVKSFSEDKKVTGKSYIDCVVKDLAVAEGSTVVLNCKKAYLNNRHVEAKTESFDKLELVVVECEVEKCYSK